MSGSPPMPKEPLRPSFSLQGYHQGAPFGASAPENWCQSVDPLQMSISTPRATQVSPNQDPATLRSTISSPNSLIRDQSSGSCIMMTNRYYILHKVYTFCLGHSSENNRGGKFNFIFKSTFLRSFIYKIKNMRLKVHFKTGYISMFYRYMRGCSYFIKFGTIGGGFEALRKSGV